MRSKYLNFSNIFSEFVLQMFSRARGCKPQAVRICCRTANSNTSDLQPELCLDHIKRGLGLRVSIVQAHHNQCQHSATTVSI